MHRFFLPSIPIHVNQPVDLTPLLHQLRNVLRLTPGALIIVLDNQGNEFDVCLRDLNTKRARGEVVAHRFNNAEPLIYLTLYQCSLKADKFEWILQKGTELGVRSFVPVISERSIVRPASALLKKYDRWQAILREAAEQCGRGRIPTLLEPMSWLAAIEHAEGTRLLPWEAEAMAAPTIHTFVTERLSPTDTLPATAIPDTTPPEDSAFAILVGPEGGITANEAAQAEANGWHYISLGPRILRAETAALAATTILIATTDTG